MLTLNPDGTVTVHLLARDPSGKITDRDVAMRRPSIGEYRALRESVTKLGAVHDDLVAKAQAENDAYRSDLIARGDDFDVEEWAVREQHARDNLRLVVDSADDLRLSWFHEVYETLVGTPLTDDEIPSTIVDAAWPVQLQQHWRAVPLVRGGA